MYVRLTGLHVSDALFSHILSSNIK